MAWWALGLTVVLFLGLLTVVWIATRQSRLARIIGIVSVVSFVPISTFGPMWKTNIGTWFVGLAVITTQAAVLGIFTVWIASRQSRLARIIGGIFLSVLALTLIYGIILGPMWKTNFVIIAVMMTGWVAGRNSRLPVTE